MGAGHLGNAAYLGTGHLGIGRLGLAVTAPHSQGPPLPGSTTPRVRHSQGEPLYSVSEHFINPTSVLSNSLVF